MKFTLSWLHEHLDTQAGLDDVLQCLNAIGLEVEGVENPAEKLRDFRVAKVLEAGKHPNADKLQLLKVDAGGDMNGGKPWQVVCGAPNARAGMIGVFAPPGTYVPGAGFELKPAKIRDVESFGMMCSARELELSEDHDGIIELADDAPLGAPYPDYAGLDDPVIEVSVTPNKQDCMGVRGIARDLAAAGLGTLKPLDLPEIARVGDGPAVRTDDPDGCPAFFGCAVTGVRNGPSPDWMQRRLKAIGQKPISTLVDITNYVMMDLGRPLHVYDMATLNGPLVARKAKTGESVEALNGKTYILDEGMTVIADDSAVHDIGGIMGGMHSGSQPGTTDVLIECAYFTPENIAKTGQKLSLTSDARQRFERGVDPAFLETGLDIATAMVVRLCGGVASAVTHSGRSDISTATVEYDPHLCRNLGGLDVTIERQREILQSLGFKVGEMMPWHVSVPSWRRDVHGPADLVEEIIRIEGIDKVPSTPLPRPGGVARPTLTPIQLVERGARRAAASLGLNEAVNWSFISEKEAEPFGGGVWSLANPISEELKVMRPSLLPGLLSAARRNIDRGADSIRLFEIGRRYFKADDGASEEKIALGLVLTGDKAPRGWSSGKAQSFDPYDAKGLVLAILAAAGAPAEKLMDFAADGDLPGAHYHPGQSATLRLGPKNVLAAYGALHPATARKWGIKGAVMAAEIYLDAIPAKGRGDPIRAAYSPPALQAVTRDFAFLAPVDLAAGDLVKTVKTAEKKAIVDARLFDLFEGDGLPEGKKSLAIEVTLQPGEKSFTDDELKAISDKVVAAAAKKGAELRG